MLYHALYFTNLPTPITDVFGIVWFNVLATPDTNSCLGELLRETSVHTSYPKITFLVNKNLFILNYPFIIFIVYMWIGSSVSVI